MSHLVSRGTTMNLNQLELSAPPSLLVSKPDRPTLADHLGTSLPKWTWSCRELVPHRHYPLVSDVSAPPRPGDVALVRIEKLGYHSKITTSDQGRLRLYPGDTLVTVFGNRYATDAYEGLVQSTESLHLLTGGGMIGTVTARHRQMKNPTHVRFLGYLGNENDQRLNLKQLQFRPTKLEQEFPNVVLLVGTGMNSGKTTTGTRLTRGLLAQGLRVAACKITGSVSERDQYEMRATGAHDVRDFSDYGFPSTYLCDESELVPLFETMLADAVRIQPDIVVMEIADGLLQRETQLLLRNEFVRQRVRGIVHTAGCAASALYGLSQLECCGHDVIALSGVITNSPLFVRELAEQTDVPVCSSAEQTDALALEVMKFCRIGS